MTDIYRQLIDRLTQCKRVLVTTHVRPDGDAIGTTAALVLAMRKAGIDAEVLLLSHLPTKYSFVFEENGIVHTDVENGWPERFPFDRFDALLVADTGTWSQLPGLKERIEGWRGAKLVLDHHLTQEDWADLKLVITEAAAAGEIAAELIEQWNIPIDSAIATALYVAIASDTGWFQFSNTRPFTHRLAATLIEKGVDTDGIYQMLYQNERAERVALQTRALQSLDLLAGGRLAIMKIGKDDFKATNARVPDTENLINVPLQIRTVEVVALITDPPEGGPIRVSLRSKGQLDCSKFAEQFGGGGHAGGRAEAADRFQIRPRPGRLIAALAAGMSIAGFHESGYRCRSMQTYDRVISLGTKMLMPNAQRAIIAPEKLRDFLLNPDHRKGTSKAKLLIRCGYSSAAWKQLETDLCTQHLTAEVFRIAQTHKASDVGTIVDRHVVPGMEDGYSAEFFDMTGNTVAVVTIPESQLRADTGGSAGGAGADQRHGNTLRRGAHATSFAGCDEGSLEVPCFDAKAPF